MATIEGPGIVTSNLVFYYDTKNVKSYDGRPTTNIAPTTFINYNNVPGSVTTVLTTTNEFYKDAIVYKQTLTALDATGLSYLTNANNPGIGVYTTTGGGGLANRYTGHSIFFKPTCPMNSQPIFTNYSNIAGWQTNNQYDDMGDGWFRAKVIWYDTVTRSDGKYWAINPLSATIGVPLTIYWAGPFKEDLNSLYVSQYTVGTRSNTNALFSLVQNPVSKVTIDLSLVSFDSNCDIIFNGVDDNIDIGIGNTYFPLYNFTCETWVKSSGLGAGQSLGGIFCITYGLRIYINADGSLSFSLYDTVGATSNTINSTGTSLFNNTWRHIICCNDGIKSYIYIDGILNNSGTSAWSGTTAWSTNTASLGRDNNNSVFFLLGSLAHPKIYNKCLTTSEVFQNYNMGKTSLGIVNYKSAYEIKLANPSATSGLYTIVNPGINGGNPTQIYADMTTDGGGWTLIMTNSDTNGWTYANAITRNSTSPSVSSPYSIIGFADALKRSQSGFQYMIDSNVRGTYGGIWTANSNYSFTSSVNTNTNITLNIKFSSWTYADDGIEERMPYYSNSSGIVTTSSDPNGNWWGTLITAGGWSPAPWMNNAGMPNPGIIWYWVR